MAEFNPHNNGGKTDYYDLPKPKLKKIVDLIDSAVEDILSGRRVSIDIAYDVFDLFPETLNDLIEHKDMRFWRGDAFKALYALDERAAKANDGSSTEVRELNKVIYYCQRRLDAISKQEKEKAQANNL